MDLATDASAETIQINNIADITIKNNKNNALLIMTKTDTVNNEQVMKSLFRNK